MFSNTIKQLLYNLPLDKVTAEGTLFWSGAKKPPTAIAFDPFDATHLEFIKSAANLRATMYNLSHGDDGDDDALFQRVLATVKVQGFK